MNNLSHSCGSRGGIESRLFRNETFSEAKLIRPLRFGLLIAMLGVCSPNYTGCAYNLITSEDTTQRQSTAEPAQNARLNNGSYQRSVETVKSYLQESFSIISFEKYIFTCSNGVDSNGVDSVSINLYEITKVDHFPDKIVRLDTINGGDFFFSLPTQEEAIKFSKAFTYLIRNLPDNETEKRRAEQLQRREYHKNAGIIEI